jgi:hypothetical protein
MCDLKKVCLSLTRATEVGVVGMKVNAVSVILLDGMTNPMRFRGHRLDI